MNKYKTLIKTDQGFLLYKKGVLYQAEDLKGRVQKIGSIPQSFTKRIVSKVRLLERLFRLEPRAVVREKSGNILLSQKGNIFEICMTTGKIEKSHSFRMGMNNPLQMIELKGVENFETGVVYGEYWGNSKREEVCIYQKGKEWKKKYAFPAGEVTHIHGIYPDTYRKGIIVLTGDENFESGIWMFTDDFQKREPIAVGKQKYRACVVYPEQEGILYATDTPLEKNQIVFLRDRNSFWQEEILGELPGPCIYSKKIQMHKEENLYMFVTSVEPDSRIKGIPYLFSYKLGKGVEKRACQVIVGNPQRGFEKITEMKKDIWPMGLFQFGNSQFVEGDEKKFLITPQSIKGLDGKTVWIKV